MIGTPPAVSCELLWTDGDVYKLRVVIDAEPYLVVADTTLTVFDETKIPDADGKEFPWPTYFTDVRIASLWAVAETRRAK